MKIDMAEVEDLLGEDPHMLLVDVRTRAEFDEGHIPGAGNMAVDDICDCLYDEAIAERGLDGIAHARGMELSDDASAIVLYCRSGQRSARAVEHMEALGYMNVYDAGGIGGWHGEVVTSAQERAEKLLEADKAAVAAARKTGHARGHGHDRACSCGHDHAEG